MTAEEPSILMLEVPAHQKSFLLSLIEGYEVLEGKDVAGQDSSAPCLECSTQSPGFRCYIRTSNIEVAEKALRQDAQYMNMQLRLSRILSP